MAIEKLKLWLLNRHTCRHQNVRWIVDHPAEETGMPHWNFPMSLKLFEDVEHRCRIYEQLIEDQLLSIFAATDNAGNGIYQKSNFLTVRDSRKAFSTITKDGMEVWEREFDPDWSKWWDTDQTECSKVPGTVQFVVRFLSLEFWSRLRNSLDVLLNLDQTFGIQSLEVKSFFGMPIVNHRWVEMGYMATFVAKRRSPRELQTAIEDGRYQEYLEYWRQLDIDAEDFRWLSRARNF